MKLVAWLSTCSLALLGCALPPPPDVDHDADPHDAAIDAAIDASVDAGPDANTACVPDSVVCEADHYVQCSSAGVVEVEIDCPLGCDGASSRCLDVDPSNGLAEYLDMARDDVAAPAVTLGTGSTIDTDSGIVFDGTSSVSVPSADLGAHRVFMVESLAVSGNTTVTGSRGLMVVADGSIEITALLDVSANLKVNGPGGGAGSCDGVDANSASLPGGAGGAGNGDAGASGGTSNNGGSAAGPGGALLADVDLEPLRGGCEGGQSGVTGDSCLSGFGGGGGAIQLVSRVEVNLLAAGVIDASGGGGVSASAAVPGCVSTSARGGGGGGSGGSVLIEAPQVRLEGGAVVISTKGGGGSAGGIGALLNGEDGGIDEAWADGGVAQFANNGYGGRGGTSAQLPTDGQAGNTSGLGGGGGGAVGRTRVNTSAGTVNPVGGAAVRSKITTGSLRTRLVP